MEEKHKKCLERNLYDICQDLDPSAIYASLIQGNVLTFCDTQVIDAEVTRSGRALKLVEILQRKGRHAFDVFINALKSNHRHLHDLLQDQDQSFEFDPPFLEAEKLERELKQFYLGRLGRINPVPWLHQYRFSAEGVYIEHTLVRSEALYSTQLARFGQEVRTNQLFTRHELSDDPKRILIEADPGMGKSMLCQMLALTWSRECSEDKCGSSSPCIHSFNLLFNLRAKNFSGCTSIEGVISECLLARDSGISQRTMNNILKRTNVLFVIDAYDEKCGENQLLMDLIEGLVQRNATVLIASRPAHLIQKLSFFDSIFVVCGFSKNNQMEYVEKLAKQMKMSDEQLSELRHKMKSEWRDLCENPLIITILCLLCTEVNTKLPRTRTGIYSAIHELITDKASQILQWNKEELQDLIFSPLSKLSFDTYNSKRVISKGDLESLPCSINDVLQTDYLSKESDLGLLNTEQNYSFSHRTFHEFLAAMHLQMMTNTERQEWLQDVNVARDETIITFLFGLLTGENLTSMASLVMGRLHYNSLQSFYAHSCKESHLQLKLLSELNDMPLELNDVISEHCPVCIHITRDCSPSCLKGALHILNICRMKSCCIELIFDLGATTDFIAIMKKSAECEGVKVQLLGCTSMKQLDECLAAMNTGQKASCVRNVWVISPQVDEQDVRQNVMSFGDRMHAMRLYGCHNVQFSLQFLKAAQKSLGLKVLSMDRCEMDDFCMKLMQQLLKNPFLEDINCVSTNNMAQLLPIIADLNRLHKLSISLDDMDEKEIRTFGNLLKKNTLQWLSLDRCSFSAELCNTLSQCFPEMPFLRSLLILNSYVGDQAEFGRSLSAARHLNLERLCLYNIELNQNNLEIICGVLPELTDIKLLFVNAVDLNHDQLPQTPTLAESSESPLLSTVGLNHTKVPWTNRRLLPMCVLLGHIGPPLNCNHLAAQLSSHATRLQELFGAIARCQKLEELSLAGMQIGDNLIDDVSKMLMSLKKLKCLDLRGNKLTNNALKQLSQRLHERPKMIQKLDITGNQGINEDTVSELQKCVTYVMRDEVEFAFLAKIGIRKSDVVPCFGLGCSM
ncbi:hypothetical protein CAPTEDRAFT_195932 [Capitella teleta]|uniref:CARD domain-containing protein n=1 Tax=Capitella teleta TaxID=283909 RepID=R7UV69_CAPTE|nr:hypothetical protein CAPTEDRAFT_195932 [Capitella teleta]|eukprot:ELU07296.1 hypothetical protein CAPTEDRAFT_195932 [Capitella teleta]